MLYIFPTWYYIHTFIVYDRPCASDDDCGDGEAYNCSTDGKCVCADDYVLSDSDGISVCNPGQLSCHV